MSRLDAFTSRLGSQAALAWLCSLVLLAIYLALPDSASAPAARHARPDEAEDAERLEILDVSPHDPYPGGTISVSFANARGPLEVFANKTRLSILAQRGDQIVAALPRDIALGDLKVRLASLPDDASRVRSKAFHVRARAPAYRKLFRSLVGGVALVVLGVLFLARGVRGAVSVHVAKLLAGASKKRGLLLGMGALLGALAQTTTGAIGILSGLVSSRVLGVAPATMACLAAPLGAAAAPLLVAGLIEPREGLLIVALGVLWLSFARGRRPEALAGMLLGSGLVAFGLHVFRPALEPLLADSTVFRLAGDLRAQSAADLLLCASLGAVAVALLHGPAPLIVLLLGIAQATQHADLRTLLALLAGSSAGAAIAGLITAPASSSARIVAKAHLYLGLLGSLVAIVSLDLWLLLADRLLGPMLLPLHWTQRAPVSALGVRLTVSFGLSQLLVWVLLTPLVPRLCAMLGAPKVTARLSVDVSALRARFDHVLRTQKAGLSQVFSLALSGERARGQEAEQTLSTARREVEVLLEPAPAEAQAAALEAVSFSLLQLQNALDHLLQQTELLVDAEVAGIGEASLAAVGPFDRRPLEALHRLLEEGLEAARLSLAAGEPIDIEAARSREIQMNRIEAEARGSLLHHESIERHESRLRVLQVVDAYEVSGNQAYRLAELLCHDSLAHPSATYV